MLCLCSNRVSLVAGHSPVLGPCRLHADGLAVHLQCPPVVFSVLPRVPATQRFASFRSQKRQAGAAEGEGSDDHLNRYLHIIGGWLHRFNLDVDVIRGACLRSLCHLGLFSSDQRADTPADATAKYWNTMHTRSRAC